MRKVNWECIKNGMGQYGKPVLYGLAALASYVASEYIKQYCENATPVGYDGAVRTIMNSSMFSSDKTRAIAAMKPNCDAEVYKAVVHIVNGNAYSSDKIAMIANLFES